jgi:hypothetical protein
MEAQGPVVSDGDRSQNVVSFARPYEHDGTSLIAATTTRAHTLTRGDDAAGRSDVDAELSGSRPIGAFVVRDGRVRWHPAVDWTRVITTAEVMAGGVLIAHRLATRPSAAKARVTMGPGGWVSMRGGVMAVRPAERAWRRGRPHRTIAPSPRRRPWWARLLGAMTLESLVG